MQAYMKSSMPFMGVSAPELRDVCKLVFRDRAIENPAEWRRDVLAIWRGAKFREERYGAIGLTGDRRAREFQTMESLPMYEEMIVSGAWWDYIDSIAPYRLGEILRAEPKKMRRAMLTWSRDENMWKRRSSIICQLNFKKDTDLDLLFRCIEPSLASREFFLRKAIGWVLRQYARTDPDEVRRYVRAHEGELSPLSRREAMKHL